MLVLPLAGQTGIFDSLFVDTRLTVTGDTVLADDSIQEAEIDIFTAPTDNYIFRWDANEGKPAWEPIGFDTADWSSATTTASNCPITAGGPNSNGPSATVGRFANSVDLRVTSVLVNAAQPYLNYDVTVLATTGNKRVHQFDSDGTHTLLASGSGDGQVRISGQTAVLPSGTVSVQLGTSSSNVFFCPDISSIWVSAV